MCRPLMTLANSLDPDQANLTSGRTGSKLFDILLIFLKEFFQKVNFEIINRVTDGKKARKITQNAMS